MNNTKVNSIIALIITVKSCDSQNIPKIFFPRIDYKAKLTTDSKTGIHKVLLSFLCEHKEVVKINVIHVLEVSSFGQLLEHCSVKGFVLEGYKSICRHALMGQNLLQFDS